MLQQPDGSWSISSTWTLSALGLAAGVYSLKLSVTDKDAGEGVATALPSGLPAYIVTFDASAGFVTGGGWVNSAPGAYAPTPTLAGRARSAWSRATSRTPTYRTAT